MNRSVFFLLILCYPVLSFAQKIDQHVSFRDLGHEAHFRFSYDNDYFAASDRNYTQGYSFEVQSPGLAKNPFNKLLINKDKADHIHRLVLEHIGFTPRDIVSEEIQVGDRPFASAIMLKSIFISVDKESGTRLSSSLSLGMMGRVAFGEWMQVSIHRATDNRIPRGWKHQIQNDLVLNYELAHEKELMRSGDFFALKSDLAARLGTLSSKAQVGMNLQIGRLGDKNRNTEPNKSWKVFAYARPLLSVIEYDATLQGGKFNRDSPYTIASSEIERLVGSVDIGVILQSPSIYLEFFRAWSSPEFEDGEAASYGGLKVGWKI